MKRRPSAKPWRAAAAIAVGACGVALALNLFFAELRPGSPWGLTYGIVATVLLFTAVLYGARRRAPRLASRLRLGSARNWLQLHVWGSVVFLVLVLMHSGFRWPEAPLTGWLLGLSVWTVASGLAGLALQRWIPKVLASGLTLEVHFDRVAELIDELRRRAEDLAASCSDPVRSLYSRRVAPGLAGPRYDPKYYLDVTGGIRGRLKEFEYLRRFLPSDEKERLHELEGLYRAKLEIDAHYTLQQALRWWLAIHVPPAVVLAILVVLHIFTVLYY